MSLPDKLIVIDGYCNFCHSTVKWVEKYTRNKNFYYTNLQSELGQKLLAEHGVSTNDETVLFLENGILKTHSTAILSICKYLKFPYNFGVVFLILPTWFRDYFYRFFAHRRYRWFGKKETCQIPEPGFKERVLESVR